MERQAVIVTLVSKRAFIALVAAVLFIVSNGWGSCSANATILTGYGNGCDFCSSNPSNPCMACDPAQYGRRYCEDPCTYRNFQNCVSLPAGCSGGEVRARWIICTTKCESDSVAHYQPCIDRGGTWDGSACSCIEPSSSSQALSSSSVLESSSSSVEPMPLSSSSVIECETRYCCDSLARNRPVETDTIWEGCVPVDPTQPGCVVYRENVTPGDTTLGATCNGKSQYMVCTKEWTWSESARQCAQLETNNCVRFTQSDSMCSDVICYVTQYHGLSALDYNNLTMCYTGTEYVQKVMVCSNGNREDMGSYSRPWKVCKPYLDSLGTDIGDYVAGKSGYSGSGFGVGGGSGGGSSGGSGGGSGGGTGGPGGGNGNGMANGYGGGTSVDGEGNEVTNSPSPGIGGSWTPTPQIVTETDSEGNVTVVKNSQGGDSIQVVDTWNQLRCLGVSNGIATLTNGLSTWTCEAMSCSQATLSASINGGACSPGSHGIGVSETNPSMPSVNYGDNMASSVDVMFGNYEAIYGPIVSTLNSNHYDDKRHFDSLSAARDRYWKITFGNDLSYIDSIRSKVGQNVSATEGVAVAVGSASQSIASAVGAAATSVGDAVSAGASDVRTAVSNVRTAVNDLNTAVGDFKNTYVVKTTDINGSIVAVGNQVQKNRDTIHNTNVILENIRSVVADTGRNVTQVVKDIDNSVSSIPASIWSIDSNISSLAIKVDSFSKVNLEQWSNDKLVMIIDTNVKKVADAIDSLKLDVNLDSISVIVEHDPILDSIDARLQVRSSQSMQFIEDTLDLASVYSQAFNEAKVDSNIELDSSVVEDMRSRFYVNGSDVVDPTNVDSVSSVLNSKLDSSNAHYNARSDSMTRALVDSTLKYSGIDSGGAALRRFFDVPNNGCPRQCLDITLQIPQNLGGGETKIKFSDLLCDKKIIGNYGVLDFVKLVLRILTAYLSLMFIWNAMWYLNTGAKKK